MKSTYSIKGVKKEEIIDEEKLLKENMIQKQEYFDLVVVIVI